MPENREAALSYPLEIAQAHGEIIAAAREFVGTTSVYQQKRVSRPSFERLAYALLDLDQRKTEGKS